MRLKCYFTLFLTFSVFRFVEAGEKIQLEDWVPPLYKAQSPSTFNETLAIYSDGSVYVYATEASLEKPRFLWKTPGKGQGPGEINGDFGVNSLSWERETGNLWVCHRYGVAAFDTNGKLFYEVKFPGIQSYLALNDRKMYLTATHAISDVHAIHVLSGEQFALGKQFLSLDHQKMPLLKGIPVRDDGSLIPRKPQMLVGNKQVYWLDAFCGELYGFNESGELKYKHGWKPIIPIDHELKDYLKDGKNIKTMQLGSAPFQKFGALLLEDRIWLVRMVQGTPDREISLEDGSKWLIPSFALIELDLELKLLSEHLLTGFELDDIPYLFSMANGVFSFLEQRGGETIHQLTLKQMRKR